MHPKKVIVTGGAGFIGSHIVDRCLLKGWETIVVDNLSKGEVENIPIGAKFYHADIRSHEMEMIIAKEQPDVIVHQAAQTDVQYSINEPLEDASANILSTIRILELAVKYGVQKFVYASSAAIYGTPEEVLINESHPKHPMSGYGVSKYVPELYISTYAKLYGLKYGILRYANVYGPRQASDGEGGVVAVFVDRLLRGEKLIIFGDGEQTRDFIFVEDIADANIAAILSEHNVIVNIGTSQPSSINRLVSSLQDCCEVKTRVEYRPARAGDIMHSCLDNQQAIIQLGWEPKVRLEEGLWKTYSHRLSQMKQMAKSAAHT
ncbi:NAD-dependent epimerase/dehydratase family protein [Paenibacillus glycanilyticus]|uniref:UDP-glucose 4-epimerase n=1 Tax=Paenibacillus glycanilyticus TaxID=126569 RepID=A0ABQ6G7B9_9BACL|nr:NAD-dependent epimerase/dehydratase family protein [Paenibacillus glycanilyticus]GLX66345.1 UDP-glucose 4-epimerase [Paenibacillus glycanilyticus]